MKMKCEIDLDVLTCGDGFDTIVGGVVKDEIMRLLYSSVKKELKARKSHVSSIVKKLSTQALKDLEDALNKKRDA